MYGTLSLGLPRPSANVNKSRDNVRIREGFSVIFIRFLSDFEKMLVVFHVSLSLSFNNVEIHQSDNNMFARFPSNFEIMSVIVLDLSIDYRTL